MTKNIKFVVDLAQTAWLAHNAKAMCEPALAAIGVNMLTLLVSRCRTNAEIDDNLLASIDYLDELIQRIDHVRETLDQMWHVRAATPKSETPP